MGVCCNHISVHFYFMKCIDFPYFSPKAVAVSGVYRLWFDEKWYYIGSTNNLRRRLLSWKFALLNNVPKNKNIKFILSEITNIRVEIVENCDNYREIEDKLIKESIDELLCLNRCPDATS